MTEEAPVGVLVMAHGTPERLEDLPAFYTEIRRGRPPSDEQLEDLRRRYVAIGGTSPLNALTAAQAAGIAAALEERRPGRFVVRAGARFAAPRIEDGVGDLVGAGCTRIVGLVLAPHSSRASVGEYERRARAAVGSTELVMVDHWWDAPGFDELVAARVRAAFSRLDGLDGLDRHLGPTVVFSAHSVPASLIAAGDTYAEQVARSAAAVAAAAGVEQWDVAWQSAGRTDDEWLGPDVRDVVAELAARGVPAVVVCPIGFVSDHLEVLYDVDVEVRAAAERAGIAFARTESLNASPDFCTMLAGVVERAADAVAP